jgi:prophage DNA circulation protein
MGSIRDVHNEWRDNLVPASFRGAVFHVESSSRASGRRVVNHQYPKRNQNYAEDMGRESIRYNFNGYLILRDKGIGGGLLSQIAFLLGALEADEAGMLIHPTLGAMLVMCERYSYSDKRTAGGYVEFDMQFLEAGSPAMMPSMDAGGNLTDAAGTAETSASGSMGADTGVLASGRPMGQGGIGHA